MRYLKTFESIYMDNINKKTEEYEKYVNKFIIYSETDKKKLYVGRYMGVILNDFFAKIESFDWDPFDKGYIVDNEILHLDDFNILDSFVTLKQANAMLENMEKYNL